MYKKTKPRSVMELLNKNLSEREVAAILGCSRNTVSEIKELCRQQGMTWDDIQDMTDDGLYDILYPKKFKRTTNYVPVDYAYVHSELKKTGVTMKLLWEEYRDKCVSEDREYCAYTGAGTAGDGAVELSPVKDCALQVLWLCCGK